jgi:ADP-dependent NAD(P)H-hydrate dehydratase / NAD(P)H-hydrate epimerase
MLPILSAEQVKKLDAYTIRHEPITSIDLMERASQSFVDWYTQRFHTKKTVGIVCGTGNNGGDGLAIARMLLWLRYTVTVWVVKGSAPETTDFNINLQRLQAQCDVTIVSEADPAFSLSECDVVIDAIFGSGLNKSVAGIYESVIHKINQAPAVRIAIDVPSGMFADKPTSGVTIHAHHTVSFQLPKLAFMLPQSYAATGEWHVVDIGLSNDFLSANNSEYFLTEKADAQAILKPRRKFDHKGTFGSALLVAGSYGKLGAAVLAARAAMRAGVGLLTVHVPRCGYQIIQTAVPEAMASVDMSTDYFSSLPSLENIDAVGIGPGVGQASESKKAFQQLLEKLDKPLVLDADALNLLATHRELISLLPAYTILTPHPGEFARLVGNWKDDFHRLELQQAFCKKTNSIVVLKGAHSSISAPDGNVYFNTTGNPGMATGGSGDVLTGIITSLLAQGYEPLKAALFGTHLHGLAGDLAAQNNGYHSLVASDIVEFIPNAYQLLEDI